MDFIALIITAATSSVARETSEAVTSSITLAGKAVARLPRKQYIYTNERDEIHTHCNITSKELS
jgi:hypothetical protein